MNPRYPYGYTRLPIVHLRPLGHLSKLTFLSNSIASIFETTSGERGIRGSSRDILSLLPPPPARSSAHRAPTFFKARLRLEIFVGTLRFESLSRQSGVLRSKTPKLKICRIFSNGERGIRTPGALRYNGFRDRPIQPLSHLSGWGTACLCDVDSQFGGCSR